MNANKKDKQLEVDNYVWSSGRKRWACQVRGEKSEAAKEVHERSAWRHEEAGAWRWGGGFRGQDRVWRGEPQEKEEAVANYLCSRFYKAVFTPHGKASVNHSK